MDTQLDNAKSISTGHSSDVEMRLYVGSIVHSVLQSSEKAIKLQDPQAVEPGDAVLEISIDGRARRWPIRVLGPSARANWTLIEDR